MNPELTLNKDREGTFGLTDTGQTTITFQRLLNHSVERVWQAITDPEETKVWFPFLRLDARAGGQAIMDFSGGDCPPNEANPEDLDVCTVTEFDPPNLVEYLGPTGGLRWELTPVDDKCKLVMTATNAPGQSIIYSIVCGWHHMVDQLEWTLDGVEFEFEGYAGPLKVKIYEYYKSRDLPEFTGI